MCGIGDAKAREWKNIETDILVIGSGGAGMRAAIEAADNGASVSLVGKTLRGKAHTAMAEGGIAAPLGNVDPEDSWEQHLADTMRDGMWVNDYRLAEELAREAASVIKELESYGAIFDRTPDGSIQQRAFGAHTYKRTCHIGDRTGLEIMNVLTEQVQERDIDLQEEVVITKLLTDDGKVSGAIGLDMQEGEFVVFRTRAVISAAGGCTKIYKRTTNPWETVGDGSAMALEAGADLIDMEMIQFHPTGLVYPDSAAGILVTESVRGEGGRLFNSEGERFMKDYSEKWMELAARDVVARAIFDEVHAGRGTEHGGVHLDISHRKDRYVEKKLPKMVKNLQEIAGVDIRKEAVEVAPTAHYTMGGIRVDPETMETTLENFHAAGEVTGQVHGANRLGSNSLTGILVFGRKAGKGCAESLEERFGDIDESVVKKEIEEIESVLGNGEENPLELKEEMGELMWEEVGIYRDEGSLNDALERIEGFEERMENVGVPGSLKFNHGLIAYLDLRSMIRCSKAIIKSAMERTESRGAHHREDYPDKEEGLYNVRCFEENGEIRAERIETPEPKGELLEVLRDEEGCPY